MVGNQGRNVPTRFMGECGCKRLSCVEAVSRFEETAGQKGVVAMKVRHVFLGVIAFLVLVGSVVPANAAGHHRRHHRHHHHSR
jgi:hypothetical protein